MEYAYLIQLSPSDLQTMIADTIRAELGQLGEPPGPDVSSEDELLRVPDIMRMFGVSKQTALIWARTGHLPSVKIGARLYFPKQKVLEVLKSGGHTRRRRAGTDRARTADARRAEA